ncbi:efflux RND transporter periplasmic adaptor subunit [Stenotrophobium rhamnosiphilum]|uniref:Efflux RND transporter periplasmic adaptor subunit n=1 Tax=Stenotrophobium rhamnosiphilum TaxID=2029166 RepID=A0A2T5MJ15_9GAMM|nr:efflux RND transporter periplasmic adaptor subunit [Stenotrophobium rhamnosiphilum]PTU32576.1 efflux RND transporter periplasmic adaptor subunit [Stenotrophobium rhamnosiphilum]
MNDKSALLGQLKIDRNAAIVEPSPRWPWLVAAAVIALIVIAYLVLRPSSTLQVKAVPALTLGGASGGGSVLDASGYIVAQRQATVSSKVTGKVQELLVEEGQTVKEGQVLARLDDSNARAALQLARAQLDAARAGLSQANAQSKDASRQAVRNKELVTKGFVGQSVYDTAQSNADAQAAGVEAAQGNVAVAQRNISVYQQQLDDTVVRAPFAGVITVKNAQQGEMISPLSAGGAGTRTGIGTLVDMDSLEIEVDVNENFIGRVQPGQPVTGKLNAYPEWEIPCKVIAVIPTADRSKATVKVRIGINNKDPRILPDMGVRVSFLNDAASKPAEAPKGVWVPADAVQVSGDTGVLFVIKNEKLERRAVKLGGKSSAGQQVLSGVTAGDSVAVGDLSKFSDGAKVVIAE